MLKTLFATLQSGDTEVDITDSIISDDSIFEVYQSNNEVAFSYVSVNGNTASILFDSAPTEDIEIALLVNNLVGEFVPFSGDYEDLANKPTLFSGNYEDLTNKPTLFSGDYEDLTNKPNIPDIDVVPLLTEGEHIADIDVDETTFSLYAPAGGQQIYDGNEHVIGTWFGKTLYMKSIPFIPTPSSQSISLGVDNIDMCVLIPHSTYVFYNNVYRNLPYSHTTIGGNISAWTSKVNATLEIRYGTDYTGTTFTNGVITIMYTKTTV